MLIQQVRTVRSAHHGIQIFRSSAVTVRYTSIENGRGTSVDSPTSCGFGFGTGIGSKDCFDSSGVGCELWSSSHAIYSNTVTKNDGPGVFTQATRFELMGNVINGNQWGGLFSSASRFMVHHNQVSNTDFATPAGDITYAINIFGQPTSFEPQVGNTSEQMLLFSNVFTDNSSRPVRLDGWMGPGLAWLLDNRFQDTALVTSPTFVGNLFEGEVRYCSGSEGRNADVRRRCA